MRLSLIRLLVGRPVANREAEGRKLGVLAGVPAIGLDALGSASYGPEAALAILAAASAAALGHIVPITCVILVLLAILFLSYWQTIAAYPSNGGSYVVAKDNLGTSAGLLAAALMVDYLLNVAVGISAGVGSVRRYPGADSCLGHLEGAGSRRASARSRAAAQASTSHRGDLALAGAAGLRQRLYCDDRGGGGQ